KEYTGFYGRRLDSRFEEVLDLLADVVLAPAFTAEDVEVERGVILEEIGEANDNPEDLAHENFVRVFWKGHPLGAPILGTAETVRAIRREDLYHHHGSRYGPENLVVAAAGRVRPAEVLRAVERLFRRRPRAARAARRRPERAPRPHSHVLVRTRRGLEQAHLCLGMAAAPHASRRRHAAALLDVVLGGGMSSRLFQEVRERRGLVYTIGSSLSAYRLPRLRRISAGAAAKDP